MPLYYFILKTGRHTYPDSEGQEFPDDMAAQDHAQTVARELMRNRETNTAHWRIQVCDDYLQPRYEYLFVDLDPALERFDHEFRTAVRATMQTTAALRDSMTRIDVEMNSLRQTISQMGSLISQRPSP